MAVEGQNVKWVDITRPAAIVDNASLTTTEVDTIGYDYAEIVVYVGTTDIAMTALTVTESDTSGSNHSSVTGLVWGTSSNIDGSTSALPAAGDDGTFQIAQIDLRGRKRYLDLTATVGNGTNGGYYVAFARLSRADEAPVTISAMGDADEVLRV